MRCGTLGFKEVLSYLPSQEEMYGANLAELELVNATLTADRSLAWDLWGSDIRPSLTATS